MPTLGNDLQFSKYQLLNPRIHNTNPAPSSPVAGQMYYDNSATPGTLYWWDGTQWVAAKGGSGTPTGAAGGDLTGTYPNPTIGTGKVTSTHILDGTITDTDVAAANKDGLGSTPSLRTLGTGAAQAMPGNLVLNAITAPSGPLNLNSQRITSLQDPTAFNDAATKNYVDNVASGIDAHPSVRVATTANVTLAGSAPNTLDGITLASGDRILVKNQTAQAENGIYTVSTLGTGANGTWARATDQDGWNEVPSAFVWVEQGTLNGDTGWVCTADQGGTLGSTAITWVKFSAAPSQIVAYYNNAATHGAAATITIPQTTHGLRSSRAIHVQVQDNTTGAVEYPDVTVAANGDVTVTYGASVTANSKMVTLVG